MLTLLHKLRQGFAQAIQYIRAIGSRREYDDDATLGRFTTAGGFLAVVVLVVLGLWAVWVVPQWQVNRSLDLNHELSLPRQLELEDTYRKTITQIVLGVFGLFLLYFTWRRSVASDKTVRIAEQGHITDRFTKAIEQLGKTDGDKPNIEVRLGAIYALERIAIDSPRDHWTIMEILTAYVRQNAPLDVNRPYIKGEKPRTDIQAILTVLGRRKTGGKRERAGQRLDLTNCHLCGADLNHSNLIEAFLFKSQLQEANLSEANLQNSFLEDVNLQGAFLYNANLEGAFLSRVVFAGAYIAKANLREGFLPNSVLTVDQVKSARSWQLARYSPDLRAELGLPPESPEVSD